MYKQASKFYRNRHLTLGEALIEQRDILEVIEFKKSTANRKKKKQKRNCLATIQKLNNKEIRNKPKTQESATKPAKLQQVSANVVKRVK